jgi:hypothetical protein
MRVKSKTAINSFRAFTVLEICIVMALVSILSTLFFSSLQRFNTLLKNEVEIKQELNDFYLMRSALWRDLDESDSVKTDLDKTFIYSNKKIIIYEIENENLKRTINSVETKFPIRVEKMGIKNKSFFITFDWKDRIFDFRYPLMKSNDEFVNTYYLNKEWLNK